jgi:hypothetical protein
MTATERKRVSVVAKYALECFSESDWYSLGQITGALDVVKAHSRLLRALDFGDQDYPACVTEVLGGIFEKTPETIDDVIDHFDIDVWFQQRDPRRYHKLFSASPVPMPDFWEDGYLRLFVSHLSSNRSRVSQLKGFLSQWGVSVFVAHEDIEPSREWQREIEAALETMEVMLAVVEPGFRESAWCCQEVGYALGRKVDVVPLRVGFDPFGLFGKYQGIQGKFKTPSAIAEELVGLLLRKPRHRPRVLAGMGKSLASGRTGDRTKRLRTVDAWEVLSSAEMKALLECASLTEAEKADLQDLVRKSGAFQGQRPEQPVPDIPF